MKARDIYHNMRAIAEDYHGYTDQLIAIAKWIEAEFDYNPQKLKNRPNTNDGEFMPLMIDGNNIKKETCVLCGKVTDVDKSTPIELRDNYVEAAGQLCHDCWKEIYKMKDHEED